MPLNKTELEKGGEDKGNKSTTGKRKREGESGDSANVKAEKRKYRRRGADEEDDENVHQNTSYTMPDYDEDFWKSVTNPSATALKNRQEEFIEYQIIGQVCGDLVFDSYTEMNKSLQRILSLVKDMHNNTDNICEYQDNFHIVFTKHMHKNKKQLHKISVELEGETGTSVRDHRVMNRPPITLWSDWTLILEAIGMFKPIKKDRITFLKSVADILEYREIPANVHFDEGLLSCDCMIIADGVLEYKALKTLDYYQSKKLPSNASKVYEVVQRMKAPCIIGEMNMFFPPDRKEEFISAVAEDQTRLKLHINKPRKFVTKTICRCLYVPRGMMNAILKRVERKEWSQVLVRAMKIHLKSKNFQKLGKSLGLQKKEISECTQIAVNTNGIEREAEQKCRACQSTTFLDFKSDPKKCMCKKCELVTDRAFVLDYTFFPWENYLNGDSTSASPRKPPPALAKLCETFDGKEVRISFGDFVKDYKLVIDWLEKEQRRVEWMIDYPTQAKTLEKIIQRVKEEADKVKSINSSMGMFKQVLAQKCPACGGRDFENDTKKGNRTCKNCGWVNERRVRAEGAAFRIFEGQDDRNHFGPKRDPRRKNMSETTPGGPLYLRGIQRRAQNQQQKNSGDQASEATKEEQRRKAERKIRAVGKQLQLNDITIQRACDCFGYFRDALKKMQRPEGVLGACLALAVRENLGAVAADGITEPKVIEQIESDIELKYIEKRKWFTMIKDKFDFSYSFGMKTLLTLKSYELNIIPNMQEGKLWDIMKHIPVFIHLKSHKSEETDLDCLSQICNSYNVEMSKPDEKGVGKVIQIDVARNRNWYIKNRVAGDLFTMKEHLEKLYDERDIPTHDWLRSTYMYLNENKEALNEIGCWWWNLPLLPQSASYEVCASLNRCAVNSKLILRTIMKDYDKNLSGLIKQIDLIKLLGENSVTDVPKILLVYFRYKYDDGSSDNSWISYHEFLYYCKHREVLDSWAYAKDTEVEVKKSYNAYPFENKSNVGASGRNVINQNADDTAPAASKEKKINTAHARIARLALKAIEPHFSIIRKAWAEYVELVKSEASKTSSEFKLRMQAAKSYKNEPKKFYRWMKSNPSACKVVINDHSFMYKKCGKEFHMMLKDLHRISPDAKNGLIIQLLGHPHVNLRRCIMWSDAPRLSGWQNNLKTPPSPFPKLFPGLSNLIRLLKRCVGNDSEMKNLLRVKMWKDRSKLFWDKRTSVTVPQNELQAHFVDKNDDIMSYRTLEDRQEDFDLAFHRKDRPSSGFRKRNYMGI